MRTTTGDEGILDSILLDYKKLSEAPDLNALRDEAERKGVELQSILDRERATEYKAIDSFGAVYLTTNPASWRVTTDEQGRTYRHRPNPKKMYNPSEARKAAGEGITPTRTRIEDRF